MSEAVVVEKKFIERTVNVTWEATIKVRLEESLATPESIAEWCKGLWKIDGIDDIAKYAACAALQNGAGYEHDGIGLLNHSHITYPRVPDTTFDILYDELSTDIVEDDDEE